MNAHPGVRPTHLERKTSLPRPSAHDVLAGDDEDQRHGRRDAEPGREIGRHARQRDPPHPPLTEPEHLPVSLATGSTSATPYIAWNSRGNVAPIVASATVIDGCVP